MKAPRRLLAPALVLARAVRRGAPVPGGRPGPRHRRPGRPADPGVAVQLGGGDRAGRLVRGAVGAVDAPAAADRAPQAPVPHSAGAVEVLASLLGVAVFALVLYSGFAGTPGVVGELQRDLHLRDLLGRHADRQRAAGRRLRRAQPVALVRPGDPLGSGGGWPRGPSPGRRCATRSGSASGRRWRCSIGFAWLELVYVERDSPSMLAALSLGYFLRDARRHARLRRGGVGRRARTASAPTSGCSRGCRRCAWTRAASCMRAGP